MLATLRGLGTRWFGKVDNIQEQTTPQIPSTQNVMRNEALAIEQLRIPTTQGTRNPMSDTSSLALQMIVGKNVEIVRKHQVPKPYRGASPSLYQVRKRRDASATASPTALRNKMTHEQRFAELRRHKQALVERSRAFFDEVEPPQEKVDLPKLTDEQRTLLHSYVRQPRTKLLGEPYKVRICVDELRRLCSGDWLNDSIIDVLLSKCTDDLENVFAFTTHFYTKLENDGPKALRRWAIRKKLNVLQQEKIIVPVNRGNMHWCLAVIDNKARTMAYYDSLGGAGGDDVLKNLESYILMEADRLEPQNSAQNREKMKSYKRFPNAKGPRQTNGSDCGVFATQSAYLIAKDAPLGYSQADLDTVRENFAYTVLQLAINQKS